MDDDTRLLQRRADRERQARKQAEQIIEVKSRELFFSQRELRREQGFVARLLDTAPVAILVIDARGGILRANRPAAALCGLTADELKGRDALDALFPVDAPPEARELLGAPSDLAGGRSLTLPLAPRSGEPREVEWYRSVLADPDGGEPLLLLVGHDVTLRVRLFREVERLSITDPLTGLHNRRHFEVAARAEVERSVRYGRPLSAVMVDIDHFKRVNDTHGHAVGDRVLSAVAHACASGTRAVDLKARLGGEEFCLLLPETTLAGAVIVAERLRTAIAAARFEGGSSASFGVTASFGVAERAGPEDVDALLRRSDAALYEAKRAGRDRVATARQDAP